MVMLNICSIESGLRSTCDSLYDPTHWAAVDSTPELFSKSMAESYDQLRLVRIAFAIVCGGFRLFRDDALAAVRDEVRVRRDIADDGRGQTSRRARR